MDVTDTGTTIVMNTHVNISIIVTPIVSGITQVTGISHALTVTMIMVTTMIIVLT
jgi:hypothetical protein